MKNNLEKKIFEILKALNEHNFVDQGVSTGLIGKGILASTLGTAEFENFFENDFDVLTDFDRYKVGTYIQGLSGLVWFLSYLEKLGLIERNSIVDDDVIEDFWNDAIALLEKGDYDPLHGAIGYINFIFELSEKNVSEKLELFVKTLKQQAIIDQFGARWKSIHKPEWLEKNHVIDLGMAHGQLGIINFLMRCKLKGFHSLEMDSLLFDATRFLVQCIADFSGPKQDVFVPSRVVDGEYTAGHKLAWCYGDLVTGYVLLKVSELLRNREWKTLAIQLLDECANPKYFDLALDDAFCHGKAGVSYFFGKVFKLTGSDNYRIARDKWLDRTLSSANHQHPSSAGFAHIEGHIDEMIYGTLYGIAGIALVLYSHLHDFSEDSTQWESCFFLI